MALVEAHVPVHAREPICQFVCPAYPVLMRQGLILDVVLLDSNSCGLVPWWRHVEMGAVACIGSTGSYLTLVVYVVRSSAHSRPVALLLSSQVSFMVHGRPATAGCCEQIEGCEESWATLDAT
jgi:hypothetical protein